MEVVVKENNLNKPMHNPPFVLGVISVPDKHPAPELYSHIKATRDFNKICEDIYVKKQKEKPADRKKTPIGVWCTFGTAALFGLYKIIKHIKR